MDPILEVKGLYKVFGEAPERAFSLIEKGVDKDDIFETNWLNRWRQRCISDHQ